MTITNTSQLKDLLDSVHDYWFDADRIALNKKTNTVLIYLEKKRVNLAGDYKNGIQLIFKNVVVLTVNDTEKVRDYDLNEIRFDAASSRLIITGGIPIVIEMTVTSLNIEVKFGTSSLDGNQ